jgi:hypothetical protein
MASPKSSTCTSFRKVQTIPNPGNPGTETRGRNPGQTGRFPFFCEQGSGIEISFQRKLGTDGTFSDINPGTNPGTGEWGQTESSLTLKSPIVMSQTSLVKQVSENVPSVPDIVTSS